MRVFVVANGNPGDREEVDWPIDWRVPVPGEYISIPGLGEPGDPNDWRRISNVYWQQEIIRGGIFWEVMIWVEGRRFAREPRS